MMSQQERNIFDTLSNFQKLQYLTSAQQAWNYAESYYGGSFGSGRLYQLIKQALTNGDLRYLSHLLGGGSQGKATDSSRLTPTNQ